ncbi:MBL fold metallo-hydrolase [Desulfosarcina sp. OttesenSCG-928-G10]|nr:MBL fold metallo-hydrolase [Desulfosarcina sp. OttesenSCG-928-G10]MDL2321483.1 MBL fold metallo-hydrolase [Desulfosarcina sp. OttesenSCG-928-B08]
MKTAIPAPDLYYRPLAGRSLREMAARKLHHGKGRFHNPMAVTENNRFQGAVAWHFHKNEYREALKDQPISPVLIDWEPVLAHTAVSVTFIRHATLLIRDQGHTLLVDPVFGRLMFRWVKDFAPIAFDLSTLPVPDQVLITHGHYDHLDMDSLRCLNPATPVVTPLGYNREFKALGMGRRTQLDWYESWTDGKRKITLVPANHWTLRNPLIGPNRSLWGGYIIKTAGGPVIYIAGDTAYFDGFEQLAEDFSIDLAIFNMSAYAPRWFMGPSHMDPVETVRAFTELKATKLMIVHWGTFRLGDEPVHFPPMDLEKILIAQNLQSRWINLAPGATACL